MGRFFSLSVPVAGQEAVVLAVGSCHGSRVDKVRDRDRDRDRVVMVLCCDCGAAIRLGAPPDTIGRGACAFHGWVSLLFPLVQLVSIPGLTATSIPASSFVVGGPPVISTPVGPMDAAG